MSEARRNELFARIQVHEARIADATAARSAIPEGPDGCPERCRQASDLELHSGHICHLAEVSRDADACARCRAGRRTYSAARASDVRANCGCEAGR